MTDERTPREDLDAALQRLIEAETKSDLAAIWERLDNLEEMVSFLYDQLDIEYVGGEDVTVKGGDA